MIDVGAGDGGYVVRRARTEPYTFAIAIDASADLLAEGAWRARRERLRNAAFFVESVERLPRALSRLANEITIHFPWGSLLRGLITADGVVLDALAMTLRPGGELRALLSATERDGYPALAPNDLVALAPGYSRHGLLLLETRFATGADVAASGSSWAKRLGVPRTRAAVLARYRRADSP